MSSSAQGLWTASEVETKNPSVIVTGYELDNGLIFKPGTEDAKVIVFNNILYITDGLAWHYLTFVPTDHVTDPTYLKYPL